MPPVFQSLKAKSGREGEYHDLHRKHQIARLVLVHGTFMGDDPFAVADIISSLTTGVKLLEAPARSLTEKLRKNGLAVTRKISLDIANYNHETADRLQFLVGDDPQVSLLDPTWSSQNHHLARADLAVRLVNLIAESHLAEDRRLMLWGHSHAGQGFAILSNLLSNDREANEQFFAAAQQTDDHWQKARDFLRQSASPVVQADWVDLCTFGTPVRYGWDPRGCSNLIHISHHRKISDEAPERTQPLFPLHTFPEMVAAKYGDWVQAFAIAGTDVVPPGGKTIDDALANILERGLQPPQHALDTRLIPGQRVRDACARWKTGTRCHADGLNLLVNYKPMGRKTRLAVPIEESTFGHGVYTTKDWLEAHLELVMQHLSVAN